MARYPALSSVLETRTNMLPLGRVYFVPTLAGGPGPRRGGQDLTFCHDLRQICLEVHRTRASVHASLSDRKPYTHDTAVSVGFQTACQTDNAFAQGMYPKSTARDAERATLASIM